MTAETPEALPPAAPPVSLYANLPQEWPLARLSVQLRHIGVLLRVTLYRRVAELSFRGVDFRQLPREVMKNICHDFDNICGEMARRPASLFAFLKPASNATKHADPMGLSLYADPAYWLYGLLSFCAKACESKTAEANGTPVLGARDERGTPALEATGRTLSLMQTVVMSFGRNQSLGKPDLPIHHLRVYFPVQLVHKLVERMDSLRFTDVTPEDGKKHRHNSESKANSPYIVVGTYEGVPLVLSLSFQKHQDSQVHMNMVSLMAIWVKWPPSSRLSSRVCLSVWTWYCSLAVASIGGKGGAVPGRPDGTWPYLWSALLAVPPATQVLQFEGCFCRWTETIWSSC